MTLNKSQPFLLLILTICLLLLALVAFWVAMMPQRMLASLRTHLQQEQGLTLDARNPRLRFDSGLFLQLDSVAISGNTPTALAAPNAALDVGFAALFGGSVSGNRITLQSPVIDLDVSTSAKPFVLSARQVIIREGTVKLRDTARKGIVAVSDVNGQIMADATGGIKLDVSFMQNGSLTTLVAEAESTERMLATGSPTDISLAAKDRTVSFSGRARYNTGLALDGQITVEAPDAAQAFAWLGMPLDVLKGTGALSLVSGMSSEGLSANFGAATLKIGTHDLIGHAILQAGPDRMQLTGDLTTPQLSFLQDSTTAVLARPWSESPFAATDLTALDIDLRIAAQNLSLRGAKLGTADIQIEGKAGSTTVNVALPASKSSLNLKLSTSNGDVVAETVFESEAADAGVLSSAFTGVRNLNGVSDVSVQTTSEGKSLAAHISSLRGNAALNLAKASVAHVDLTSLLATPGEGWQTAENRKTEDFSLDLAVTIEEGVATFNKANATLQGITLKPVGEIDLLRQAFSLALQPRGKGLNAKLGLVGTWAKPVIKVDAGAAPALRPTNAAGTPTPAN